MHGNKGGNACVGGFIYLFIFNGLHKNILLLVSWINTVKYLIFFFNHYCYYIFISVSTAPCIYACSRLSDWLLRASSPDLLLRGRRWKKERAVTLPLVSCSCMLFLQVLLGTLPFIYQGFRSARKCQV